MVGIEFKVGRDMSKTTRRYHSLGKIGRFVPQITTPVFKKQGFAQAAVVSDWDHIVGPALAAASRPEGLTFPAGTRAGGVLALTAPGPIALEIQYQSSLIIERINSYFGYKAVERLKIHQRPIPFKKPHKPKVLKPLNDQELASITDAAQAIDDPILKETLENLGRAIYGKV